MTGVGDEISAVILCAPSPQLVEVAAITGKTGERGMRFSIGLPTAAPKIDVERRSDGILSRCPNGSAPGFGARAWGRCLEKGEPESLDRGKGRGNKSSRNNPRF